MKIEYSLFLVKSCYYNLSIIIVDNYDNFRCTYYIINVVAYDYYFCLAAQGRYILHLNFSRWGALINVHRV